MLVAAVVGLETLLPVQVVQVVVVMAGHKHLDQMALQV